VFEAASLFKDRCEAPRTGVDLEGARFPDQPGSAVQEKFWIRSWTFETYLWNREVQDRNPNENLTRTQYFDQMRTFERTPSGRDKDDFHFSEPTEQAQRNRLSAPRGSFGAEIVILSSRPPRDVRVVYTEPGSPAAQLEGGQERMGRGARILTIDGIDVVNASFTQAQVDAVNAALFGPAIGATTTFTVRDPGATASRTVTLTAASLAPKPVNRTRVIQTPGGPVGYILFNTFSPFSSERDIVDAMEAMRAANVNDLVLDLRYNGGGLLTVAAQLSYMVAGPTRTQGRVFERLRFNADAGNRNPVTGQVNNPSPFRSTGAGFSVAAGTPLPALGLPRVFILTSGDTCSASESVINGLRGIGVDVVLIGTTTCGKPYGFYATDNCGVTYYTIQFQGTNDIGFGDYADGFVPQNANAPFGVRVPGCVVNDDLTRQLGDPNEALLAAALGYRATATCPAPAAAAVSAQSSTAVLDGADAPRALVRPPEPVLRNNRDMTPPREAR
jgi:C-terminal processing protease CtpA/Prc